MSQRRLNHADGLDHGSEVGSAVSVAPYEHPSVYDYLGKNRYRQAAFCKAVRRLYSDKFGLLTTKALSNIAAEEGNIGLLEWSKVIGCCWDVSVFVSGAQGGSVDVVRWLVKNDCPLPDDNVAWLAAAEKGCLEVLRFAHDSKYLDEFRPLCEVAAENGHLSILKWVHEVEGRGHFDACTCQLAARGGYIDIIEWLRSLECEWDEGACWCAIDEGRIDTLKWLISNRCPWDVNGCGPDNISMLGLAIYKGHMDIRNFLINECAADVNFDPAFGRSPLFMAVLVGNLEAVKLLLDSGATSAPDEWFAMFSVALSQDHTEIMELLRNAGAR